MPDIDIPGFENVELAPPMLDPGSYVFNIQEEPEMKTADRSGKSFLEIKLIALEGPEQKAPDAATGSTVAVGRKITDRVFMSEKAQWRIKGLLICAGLLKRDDKESDMARGKFNSGVLVGARLNCRVEAQNYKKEDGSDAEGRNVIYLT